MLARLTCRRNPYRHTKIVALIGDGFSPEDMRSSHRNTSTPRSKLLKAASGVLLGIEHNSYAKAEVLSVGREVASFRGLASGVHTHATCLFVLHVCSCLRQASPF